MKKKYLYTAILVVLFLLTGLQPALAQDDPNAPVLYDPNDPVLLDPNMEEELRLPGTVEGTGTYFEVTDSNYLNITFESSEPIHLMLESVPQMVVMDMNATNEAASTQITLTGFPPSTTYYKYEDDYHNGVSFTTDDNGTYTYAQDITQPHLVFIQPQPGTIFIPGDTSVGTWDPVTRTYTLTTDVYETIEIDEDNLTLDGAGHTVTGSGFGVYLYGRSGVTIKDINVRGFSYGIYLRYSSSNTLTANNASNNYAGIWLYASRDNTLTANTASNNGYGIYLKGSSNNILTNNTASNNDSSGIDLMYSSSNNTLTGNTTNSNRWGGIRISYYSSNNTLTENTASNNSGGKWSGGIFVYDYSNNNILTNNTASNNSNVGIVILEVSNSNILSGNTANSNYYAGIWLCYSNNNTLTENTASNNGRGIYLQDSSNNQIYNNNFIANDVQAYVYRGTGNIFNLDRPIGGNYWSNWTTPDDDGDGFVDYPYVFTGGVDYLPLVRPVGSVPVAIDIKPGSYPNAINLGSYGLVPVAILSSEQFNATTVDPETVELAGMDVAVRGKSNKYMAHAEDVNGDGLVDLVLQVATENLVPDSFQDGYAILTGKTYEGVSIEGADEITIVPPE